MKLHDRTLMIPRGPVSKDTLTEWLTEVPDDAEISDRAHANEFIEGFSDVLRHALILAC